MVQGVWGRAAGCGTALRGARASFSPNTEQSFDRQVTPQVGTLHGRVSSHKLNCRSGEGAGLLSTRGRGGCSEFEEQRVLWIGLGWSASLDAFAATAKRRRTSGHIAFGV